MAKAIKAKVKLQLPGGQATPAPPVGPALGQHGVNIGEFVQKFNALTKAAQGTILPAEVTIYADRTFTFIDTHEDDIVDPTFGIYPADDFWAGAYHEAWLDLPANRHSQGANLAFADGHVEHWRWKAPKVFCGRWYQPAAGGNLADLRRLQACIPPLQYWRVGLTPPPEGW